MPETIPESVSVFWRTERLRLAVRATGPARLRLWVPRKLTSPPKVSELAPVVMAAPVVLLMVPPLRDQAAVAAPRAAALLMFNVPAVRTLVVPVKVFAPESVRMFGVLTVKEPAPVSKAETTPKLPLPIWVAAIPPVVPVNVPPATLKVFAGEKVERSRVPKLMVAAPEPRAVALPTVTVPPLIVVPPE